MKTHKLLPGFLLMFLFILSCDQANPDPESLEHFKVDFTGYVQKGPFIAGSSLTISELSSELQPTGRVYITQITDNTGKFELPNVELESRYIHMKADGFYFNERTGTLSEAQLTLHSLIDIADLRSFNINVLSHLEKDRTIQLMGTGMEFEEAKHRATREILEVFNIEIKEQFTSEQLDIANTGDSNAILLAISLILQGNRSTSEFAEFLSQMNLDLKEDGVLDSEALGSKLINGINYADLQEIRKSTVNRYDDLHVEFEIPDFEKYINQFVNNTEFLPTNQFIFPERGNYGTNVLPPGVTKVQHYGMNDSIYSIAVEVPDKRSLQIKILGKGVHVGGGTDINMNVHRVIEPIRYTTFTTTSAGLCDVFVKFLYDPEDPVLTMEYYEDGGSTPSLIKQIEILTDHEPVDSSLLR